MLREEAYIQPDLSKLEKNQFKNAIKRVMVLGKET
jgi:hypothetical protein